MGPKIIDGECYKDHRGSLFYNNDFNAAVIKRIYIIENKNVDYTRAWQGHKIEQRWFSAVSGSLRIQLIQIDNWDLPSKDSIVFTFILSAGKLDILHVPRGYVSSIECIEEGSKLLVMTDYLLGEIKDEYRFDGNYFKV
ncbi:cupin domain-containing protein [Flavobacterium xinjiangense]|jgi:hypothetical protein|uniref:dTDP-4-dehydrorhamnose 3,5-epimerase n=1 Tax=Flavobacterium xinjiangense TaxID=178356 RepID=A0A1M7MTS1_9FLAO|nr:sugar epimerase [Flavobacterium xinjiangense]SHM93961.1 dTDP-4-dehydrorhamnose 3,5-epimerase [Flavobacterium xinjiangense]